MYFKHSVVTLVFNDIGELALQLRAAGDTSYPMHWDFSSAGGIESDENPADAAARELQEELGIHTKPTFVCTDTFYGQYSQGKLGQDELFVYKALYTGEFILDPKEVAKAQFFPLEQIERMLTSGEKFHPEVFYLWSKGIIVRAKKL